MPNFHRPCFPSVVTILVLLNELLKEFPFQDEKSCLVWMPKSEVELPSSMETFVDATINSILEPSANLAMTMNVSNTAIVISLESEFPTGTYRPLGFFIRKLSISESRYSAKPSRFSPINGYWTMLLSNASTRPRQVHQLEHILHHQAAFKFVKGVDNGLAIQKR